MGSFFEKLKRGMGIEAPEEQMEEKVKEEPASEKRILKVEEGEVEEGKPSSPPFAVAREVEAELEAEPTEEKKEKLEVEEKKEKWPEPEGQLAIDVYQTESELVIQAAIAGVKPEELDISIERDVLTIKGNRQKPYEESGDYFTQECYWGPFSREVILPVEVDPDRAEATMKNGILTIRIPKLLREKRRSIRVRI